MVQGNWFSGKSKGGRIDQEATGISLLFQKGILSHQGPDSPAHSILATSLGAVQCCAGASDFVMKRRIWPQIPNRSL